MSHSTEIAIRASSPGAGTQRSGLAAALALASVTAAQANSYTTNFSNYTGLAYGVGTTNTITQNNIELQAIQGKYEVTFYPEVNMKNFLGGTRIIELSLATGFDFDFLGFSIRDAGPGLTLTSSAGGSVAVSGFSSPTFSGAAWEDLQWVRFTYTGSEAKFTSFTLADATTETPEPVSAALFATGLLGLALRRRAA